MRILSGGDHTPSSCTKVTSVNARREILAKKNFVLIAPLETIVQRIALVSVLVRSATKDNTRQFAFRNQNPT